MNFEDKRVPRPTNREFRNSKKERLDAIKERFPEQFKKAEERRKNRSEEETA